MRITSVYRLTGVMAMVLLNACSVKELLQDTPKPNILFAIADDASFQHMSAYG